MSVTDINYTLETTDEATDKDQLVVTSDILGYYNLYLHIKHLHSNALLYPDLEILISPIKGSSWTE